MDKGGPEGLLEGHFYLKRLKKLLLISSFKRNGVGVRAGESGKQAKKNNNIGFEAYKRFMWAIIS